MTADGVNAESTPTAPLPAYAMSPRPKRVKRIKLALFLSSLAACLGVTLIGAIGLGLVSMVSGLTGVNFSVGTQGFVGGMIGGLQLSAFNFILFFITMPAAAMALGLSIGRMPYRGITAPRSYARWGAIWGAILVGGTTGLIGLFGGAVAAAGALISGGVVGLLAGAGCGLLFHAIVRPARQVSDVDVNVF